jgi:gp16 family phage-associated protein
MMLFITTSSPHVTGVKSMPAVPNEALTVSQVKENLRLQGKTLKQFAIEKGFEPNDVYRVIGGSRKALYGKGHEIAVALGLKAKPITANTD